MERETSVPYSREELKSQLQGVEGKMALMDSEGKTGPEFAQLQQEHDRLTAELKNIDSGHNDLAAAA